MVKSKVVSGLETISIKKAVGVLIIAGTLTYGGSLANKFVWDDQYILVESEKYHSLKNIPGFFFGKNNAKAAYYNLKTPFEVYRPVSLTVETINYWLFKDKPLGHRVVRTAIHITNSILVLVVLKRFFIPGTALLLALVFLVHPMNVEAVLLTVESMGYFLFGMAGLAVVIVGIGRGRRMVGAGVLLFTSLLAKESGLLLVGAAGWYGWWFNRTSRRTYAIGGAVLGGMDLVVRNLKWLTNTYSAGKPPSPISQATLGERLVTMPAMVTYYLKTFFLPINLAISQHWLIKSTGDARFWPAVGGVAVTLAAAGWLGYRLRKQTEALRLYIFFLGWMAGGLVLYLNIFPLTMTVADRWWYFPMVGLIGVMGVVVSELVRVRPKWKGAIWGVMAIMIGGLYVRTQVRIHDWRNGLSLYSHDLKIAGDSFDLQNNLAVELGKLNRWDEAIPLLEKSSQAFPTYSSYYNLGLGYKRMKDWQRAKTSLEKAIRINSDPMAFDQLGYVTLAGEGEDAAMQFATETLVKQPNNSGVLLVLAMAQYKLGDQPGALEAARKAVKLENSTRAWSIYQAILQKREIIYD